MPSDIYDDPAFREDEDDFIRMEQVGDGVQGTIVEIVKLDAKFGPVLKYTLKLSSGREASFLAGSKNLKGQLHSMRPRSGDWLDIKLVELRPTTMGSPLKVFTVEVIPAGSRPQAAAAPPEDDDEDIFAS